MSQERVDRKEFMSVLGRAGTGMCLCGAACATERGLAMGLDGPAQETKADQPTKPGDKSPARAAKRMEFVDLWVPRFFKVLDATLDEPTRKKLMVANGKVCFSEFRPNLKPRAEPAPPERIKAWVTQQGAARGYAMDGEAIIFEYVGSAETGQASAEGICLCSTVEAQTAKTISPTFCWCSVGYVKEMHERVFGRPVNVDLVQSVLMGHKRCRFRITLA